MLSHGHSTFTSRGIILHLCLFNSLICRNDVRGTNWAAALSSSALSRWWLRSMDMTLLGICLCEQNKHGYKHRLNPQKRKWEFLSPQSHKRTCLGLFLCVASRACRVKSLACRTKHSAFWLSCHSTCRIQRNIINTNAHLTARILGNRLCFTYKDGSSKSRGVFSELERQRTWTNKCNFNHINLIIF